MYQQYIDKTKYDEIFERHQKDSKNVSYSEYCYLWLYRLLMSKDSQIEGETESLIHRIWTRFPLERKDFDCAAKTLIALVEKSDR